ncbi:hypothetical protein HOB76_01500, partial [Candidatus Woesearchaeota archaeon]|nr:hypothetical protein [Candidatus Woesearchaeota archaeon]
YAEELTSGLVVTAPGVPESEEWFLFSKKYKSEYGEGWNAYGPETYDIIQIFQEACKSGSCKGEDIKNYLYAMNIYHGASGNFKFDSFGEVSKPYDKYVVRKGEFVKA